MNAASATECKPRVIVADDSPDFLEILLLLFNNSGVEVLAAKSGAEVLARYQEVKSAGQEVGLIAMDVCMPPMSGNTAAVKLRAAGYTGKIIVFTAYVASNGKKASLESGVDAYFDKSVLTRELVNALVEQYCRK